jgi:hypothetical protein
VCSSGALCVAPFARWYFDFSSDGRLRWATSLGSTELCFLALTMLRSWSNACACGQRRGFHRTYILRLMWETLAPEQYDNNDARSGQ